MRVLHAADFHLDSAFGALTAEQARQRRAESRRSPERLVDWANDHGVQLLLLAGQVAQLLLRHGRLSGQTVHLGQLALQLSDLPLQRRDLSGGAVAPAAVQLLLQPVTHLCVGRTFFAGSNQGGDPPLQLRVAVHGQCALTDKGAALKHLPGDTQQHLSGILAVDARHGVGGAGVGAGEVAHRRGGPAGIAGQRQACAVAVRNIHLATHGRAAPRRKAVFVGQRAPVTGAQAVQHDPQEVAPCGLSGFVGGIDAVQARPQGQRPVLQFSECSVHFLNFHGAVLLCITYLYSIAQLRRNVIPNCF